MSIADVVAGVPVAEQGVELVKAAAEGLSGESTGIGLLGAGYSVAGEITSAVSDPIGYFGAAGVGWVIEHVPVLKDALDAVSGNPEDIENVKTQWQEKVGEALVDVGSDVRAAAAVTTTGWTGTGGDAYRTATASLSTISDALSTAASRSASALAMAGSFVLEVRNTIRDELSKLCVWAVATVAAGAAASGPTLGASVVTATNTILIRAATTAQRFVAILAKLATKLKTVAAKMSELTSATRAMRATVNSVNWQPTVTKIVQGGPVTSSVSEWAGTALGSGLKVAGDGWKAQAATAPSAQ